MFAKLATRSRAIKFIHWKFSSHHRLNRFQIMVKFRRDKAATFIWVNTVSLFSILSQSPQQTAPAFFSTRFLFSMLRKELSDFILYIKQKIYFLILSIELKFHTLCIVSLKNAMPLEIPSHKFIGSERWSNIINFKGKKERDLASCSVRMNEWNRKKSKMKMGKKFHYFFSHGRNDKQRDFSTHSHPAQFSRFISFSIHIFFRFCFWVHFPFSFLRSLAWILYDDDASCTHSVHVLRVQSKNHFWKCKFSLQFT